MEATKNAICTMAAAIRECMPLLIETAYHWTATPGADQSTATASSAAR